MLVHQPKAVGLGEGQVLAPVHLSAQLVTLQVVSQARVPK